MKGSGNWRAIIPQVPINIDSNVDPGLLVLNSRPLFAVVNDTKSLLIN